MVATSFVGARKPQLLAWANRLTVLLALIAGSVFAIALPAHAFTTFTAPLTGGADFATGFLHCTTLGPTGVLQDGTNFFATDYCNGTTYRFPATGGAVAGATAVANGLTHMLALAHGVYYGASNGAHGVANGLYPFNPATLALGPRITALPGEPRGVVGDPLSNDIYVATSSGIFRVQTPDTTPAVSQVATGNFDGIQITADGQHIWVADVGAGKVREFGRPNPTTLPAQAVVTVPGGPDGIAIAQSTAPGGVANNVFINDNNGTISRIDTNNGNRVSVVASGGSRGDFAAVGNDGCFYVSQTDKVVKLAPCFFQAPTADLSVVKTASASSTMVLQALTYNLVVTNKGPGSASAATLTDNLPAGVQFVSASSTQGSCSQSGGVVTCNLGSIPAGSTVTATVAVTAGLLPGTVTNTATVKASEADPDTSNNSSTATTEVGLLAVASTSPTPTPTPTPTPSQTVLGENFQRARVLPVTGPRLPLGLLGLLGLCLLGAGVVLARRGRARSQR